MGDINDLMRKLEEMAAKEARVNFEEIPADEIDQRLPLPPAPLQQASLKIFPTREEAEKRDKDKEYDEAMTEAEQRAEQIKKWLVQ